jgi:hypothetical protein
MRVLLQQARAEYAPLLDLTEAMHRDYAERHGMVYHRVDGAVTKWNGTWDQIPCILDALSTGADEVYWLDADAMIVSDDDLGQALPHHPAPRRLAMCRHPGPPEHWNCGVLMAQNSHAVREFFRRVLKKGPGMPPWWQQQVMNDMLETPVWGWLIRALDDRWNSTWGVNEARDPVVVAWHNGQGPQVKLEAMRAYLGRAEGG